MRFDKPPNDGFWRALHDEVGLEVRAPFATPGLWLKAALYLALAVTGYGWLASGPPTFTTTLAAYGLFNLSALLLALNLAHDGAHDALMPSRASQAIGRLARQHGVDYHCTDLPGMIAGHFRHLRRMGERPAFR